MILLANPEPSEDASEADGWVADLQPVTPSFLTADDDVTDWLHDRVSDAEYLSGMENPRDVSSPLHADHARNRHARNRDRRAEAPSESRMGRGFRTRNCRWIVAPGAVDPRGCLNFIELGKGLPFAPQRLFWLH